MQIKRKNFKTCIISLGGNDTFKNKLVKVFKAKTKCFKNQKKRKTNAEIRHNFKKLEKEGNEK